jgi:hypothetical protein
MSDTKDKSSCKNQSSGKLCIQMKNIGGDHKGTTIIDERIKIDKTVNNEQTLSTTNPIIIGKSQDTCQTSENELKRVRKFH